MILAIDFDGVIHDHKNPIEGKKMGLPIVGAKDALWGFQSRGDKIIIFCVWASSETTVSVIMDWCKFYDIPFEKITNVKPQCDVYIDDKAVRFTNWPEMERVVRDIEQTL